MEAVRQAKVKVFWTDDDWDKLGEQTLVVLARHPELSILECARKAMAQWPAANHRVLSNNKTIAPLFPRLTSGLKAALEAQARVPQLQQQVESLRATSSKDDLLAKLSIQEILERFGRTVLEALSPAEIYDLLPVSSLLGSVELPDLVAECVKRFLVAQTHQQQALNNNLATLSRILADQPGERVRSEMRMKEAGKVALPKITVVGGKPEQFAVATELLHTIAEFTHVPHNRAEHGLSNGAIRNKDAIVMWSNFTGHATENFVRSRLQAGTRLHRVFGGVEKMRDKLIEVAGM